MFGFNILKDKKLALENNIRNLEAKSSILQSDINNYTRTIAELETKIAQLTRQKQEYQGFANLAQGYIEMEELGLEYIVPDILPSAVQQEIQEIQDKIANILGNNEAIITTRVYKINNSEAKGREFQKAYCENLLMGFNAYYEKKKKAVTSQNYNRTIELLNSKFDKFNKKVALMGVSINHDYFRLCLDLLQANLDYKLTKAAERERIREERRRLKEQEQLLAEAEKAKIELQKERRMYEQSLTKALTEAEREEFEAKLHEIDKREADVDYRVNNARAGYLYIAATKSMPGLVKLGCTRRLNPLLRLRDLSSASVPFPFVCYGLVFSDDVFALEKQIHDHFDDKRFGLNKHKEFFKISPQEAVDALTNVFHCEVHFTPDDFEKETDTDDS